MLTDTLIRDQEIWRRPPALVERYGHAALVKWSRGRTEDANDVLAIFAGTGWDWAF